MSATLSVVLDAAILVFGVSSMLSIGLRYTIREVLEPLRDVRGVAKALLANFVLLPVIALLIS